MINFIHSNIKTLFFSAVFFLSFSASASNIYPEWFIFPDRYDNLIIGYSYSGLSSVEDAENMFCAFNECIVLGTLEIYETAAEDDLLKNSNYFYYFSTDSLEEIHGRLIQVDRFDVSVFTKDYISAFVIDSTIDSTFEFEAPRIKIEDLSLPQWIDKDFMEDDQFYYGTGMYTAIGNENDGWKTAEEQAIFTILTSLALEMHEVKILTRESYDNEEEVSYIEQIYFLKLKYLLRNISIIERFPDRANKLYYALARIAKNDIISPMLKQKSHQ